MTCDTLADLLFTFVLVIGIALGVAWIRDARPTDRLRDEHEDV